MNNCNSTSGGNSRHIDSNQTGIHEKIPELVARHLQHTSQRPFTEHTLQAFAQAQNWLNDWQGPLILDACCGVGESTTHIANKYPEAKVIGVDKSAHRIGKHEHYNLKQDNALILRADLNDFWRLAVQANWRLAKHFLLYPNPYPKSAHVQRRWHASPAFADILKLGGQLEVRSNWQIYIEEFSMALDIAGFSGDTHQYHDKQAITPFERKYWASGQHSWQVIAQL
ncbi:SAM-dependent methyltransferase [uncultured Paraglaciecola sp.]|uniref:tRNA (guanine(46)-N(7))-methyltransferase TrmB n=1 Tax=uncultured Paraglaciecola sp. TaxID=1765024 RepID=UPI0030DDB173|tara:strand:+ start:2763 stop:3440 length:678 start_codon:yes stop_codon:yes gene_type:complete